MCAALAEMSASVDVMRAVARQIRWNPELWNTRIRVDATGKIDLAASHGFFLDLAELRTQVDDQLGLMTRS